MIIGAGPGGYETALLAAKRGIEVVLVEAGHVGGTCLNEGCIPTKSFCKNAEVLDGLREAEAFGVTGLSYGFDFKAVAARKNAVVEQLRGGVERLIERQRSFLRMAAEVTEARAPERILNLGFAVVRCDGRAITSAEGLSGREVEIELAKGSGIVLCHENEKGIYGDIASRCAEIHRELPALKAVFDPANFIQCGQRK